MARAEFVRTMTQKGYSPAGVPTVWTLTVAIRPRSRDHGVVTLGAGKTTVTAYLHRDCIHQAADVAANALDIVERHAPQPERVFSMDYRSPAGSRESIAAWVPPSSQGIARLVCSYRNARARITLGPEGWRWLLTALMELQQELASRKVSP